MALVAASDWPGRFPTLNMVDGTSVLPDQNVRGTSRAGDHWETEIDAGSVVGDGVDSVSGGVRNYLRESGR